MGRRNDPAPDLIAEMDAIEAKVKARLDDFVAEERALRPGLPPESHRACLLRGEPLFIAMRRLVREREARQ
jgi:hypothetical protein